MRTSACGYCGKLFKTNNSKKRFCSDICRFRAWAYNDSAEMCTYCGVPADTIDHVPPRAYRTYIVNAGLQSKYPFSEVPACHECNSLLSARALWQIKERRHFIAAALTKRYAKYLRIPHRSDQELAATGTWMRKYIETGCLIRDRTKERITHARR